MAHRNTAESTSRENLSGIVQRVTFHNPDNGFCVLKVTPRAGREPVTVVGHTPSIAAGEHIQATGEWIVDRRHGRQFRAQFLKPTPPTGAEGLQTYLASGMIKGIGPVYAEKLLAAFGDAVFAVIENEPARLRQVPGIGPKRAKQITDSWGAQKAIREIMIFLHSHGVSTTRAVRIHKTYGADAIQAISENPYRLAQDIRGIGFRQADAIAARLGIEKTAPGRAAAGLAFLLDEALRDGHCGLPRDDLASAAVELLDVPQDIVAGALDDQVQSAGLVADRIDDRPCIFLPQLVEAERSIAMRLRDLRRGVPPWPKIDAEVALGWAESKTGLRFAESQRAAVRQALISKVMVITGGPGVGKTTLINAFLRIVRAKAVRVVLAAPTGRAAKRLADSTGLGAKTIHRLLEVNPFYGGFRHTAEEPLDCDLVVIDEASMIDVPLMAALVAAIPAHAGLILIGDVDQLPSVGPGQVLADMIDSGSVPVVRLTEVFRQAAASRIVTNAHMINAGTMPDLTPAADSDFHFVDCTDPEDGAAKLRDIVTKRIPHRFGLDPIRDVQVLCPMHKGTLGAQALNAALQAALNPPGGMVVERFGQVLGPGDKVMQVENDYDKDVYNGDLGIVARIDADESELIARFDGRDITYGFGELDRLMLAYATTIHKSQGSEYPAVVVPLTTQHYTMLKRKLLYTAVTRARRLVVVVGQKRALSIAVNDKGDQRRWSKLRDWLAVSDASAR